MAHHFVETRDNGAVLIEDEGLDFPNIGVAKCQGMKSFTKPHAEVAQLFGARLGAGGSTGG